MKSKNILRVMSVLFFLVALVVNVDVTKQRDASSSERFELSLFGRSAVAQDSEPDYGNDFYGDCVYCYNQDDPGSSNVTIVCFYSPGSWCQEVPCVPGWC